MNSQEAKRWIFEGVQAALRWAEPHAPYIWAGLLLAALAGFGAAVRQSRRRRAAVGSLRHAQQALNAIHSGKSVEHNLNALLEVVGGVLEATNYAFYTYDERNRVYVLKAVRHRAENFGKIKPSYSGLKPYNAKETYAAPLSFHAKGVEPGVSIVSDGDVPLLQMTVGDALGVVRLGPMGGKLKKGLRLMLEELCSYMSPGLQFMLDKEKAIQQADVVISSGRALQKISNLALDPTVTVELMLELSMRTIGAAGGCFVRRIGDEFAILATRELPPDAEARLSRDADVLGRLHELVRHRPSAVLRRGDEAFYALPPYLAATGMQRLTVVQADGPNQFLLYWWYELPTENADEAEEGMSSLRMIMGDIRQLIVHQSSLRQLSATYTNILKKLSQLLDNLSPYTVGYSEQMSRYCIIIAQEMKLPEDVVRDVALAAYLSNIGVLGISTELYQKEGKYTDKEFELMKLHAEVGASIVKVTTGNERAASYIMHHHERMDGNGYPSALKGDDIPVGAKIIAVVQTFLAKINGRPYRDPLPFSQALKTLKSASGAQLDADVVRIFIDWFKAKQADPRFNARSLGSCWEMSCSPSSVCEHCPAYRRTDVNCWDVPGNRCRAHGKQCETCFVRTEVFTRKEVSSL
ncbi:HD-GYP domain-containing protein [Paenibacillus sp.]|uniref:HD-GYP domain-containing protein n=1 Tax=Paenibacillus sp. TaxID=58172 RepID=UPI002D4B0348|nr:HD domain-containing phosphohydrolase [Paenibacillus sp.]HZG58495.1 HD domain-containing phosphohydrolase [Paenibacillus sp.]